MSASGLIWSGDLETGDLSQFDETPWNTVVADTPSLVSAPARAGTYALRASIPAGATTDDFGARSEVVPAAPEFRSGDDLYFGFSMFLDDGFPVDESWQVVAQWKSHLDGSSPIELNVEGGRFHLAGGDGHPEEPRRFEADLGPATTGVWTDWIVHVVFSADPAVGSVQVWRDGVEIVAPTRPRGGTLYPDGATASDSYLKIGYYRRSGIPEAGTVFYDDVRIGSTRRSVSVDVS